MDTQHTFGLYLGIMCDCFESEVMSDEEVDRQARTLARLFIRMQLDERKVVPVSDTKETMSEYYSKLRRRKHDKS